MPNHKLDLTGQRFGKLKVLAKAGMNNGRSQFRCECDCGNEITLSGSDLKSARNQSCGCLTRRIDLTGKRFFRWKVVEYAETRDGRAYWLCQCKCGNTGIVYTGSLTRGLSKSCGCWRVETGIRNGHATKGGKGNRGAVRTHGEAAACTVEYRTWTSMRERCQNPRSQKWPNYGGRGIKVCERWDLYENFLADMGRRPSKLLSLDRIDNDLDYSPSNCRWGTKKEQVDNRRKFGRIEKFETEELLREIARRKLNPIIDGYLSSVG